MFNWITNIVQDHPAPFVVLLLIALAVAWGGVMSRVVGSSPVC